LSLADQLCRVAVELVVVADHFVQVDRLSPRRDRGEQAARLDRAELLRIANENELRPGLVGVADHAGQMLGADHPGLIDQEDRARGKGKLAAVKVAKQARRLHFA
jgi:hypothetical protein